MTKIRSLELQCLLRIVNLLEKTVNIEEQVNLTANLNNSISIKLLLILMRRGLLNDKLVSTILESINRVDVNNSLNELHLIDTNTITNHGLEILLRKFNANIRILILNSNNFIDTLSLASISTHCSSLLHLEVENCTQITDTSVRDVFKRCKLLERINLSGCINLGNDALIAMSELKNLKSINLSQTNINDIGIEEFLSKIKSKRNLEKIIFNKCKLITNSSIELILRKCLNIKRITYLDCPKIQSEFQYFDNLKNIGWTHHHHNNHH